MAERAARGRDACLGDVGAVPSGRGAGRGEPGRPLATRSNQHGSPYGKEAGSEDVQQEERQGCSFGVFRAG